jgi:hypothetical protein
MKLCCIRFAAPVVAILLLVGCGSYQRDFEKSVEAQSRPASNALGPWVGEWRSEMNGHHGPLWCVIEPHGGGEHAFRYRAGWGVLRFGDYTHIVPTRSDGAGGLIFEGQMDLPGGVGVHHVEGRVTPESFDARYQSERGDHGRMSLKRPD